MPEIVALRTSEVSEVTVTAAFSQEKTDARCGKCDVCIDRNEVNVSTLTFDYIVEDLKKIIGEQPASIHEILQKVSVKDEQQIRNVIKFLLDNQKIVYVNGAQLMWHKKE